MPEEQEDAKTAEESSTAADAKETQAEESSTDASQQETQTEESLSSVVEKAAKESLAREAADESAAEKVSHTEEEATTKKEAPVEAEAQTQEKEKEPEVPKEFNEHPAWKRIIGERNEAREKIAKLEEAVKAETGLVQYCRERSVSPDQFKQAMDVVSLLNTDPAKAYERLRPLVEQLEAHMGLRLPEDLDKKVKEGIVDQETAIEMARLRAEKTFSEQRQQTTAAEQQKAVVSAMVTGLNEWSTNKASTDPDYAEKSELVNAMFLSLYQARDAQGNPIHPLRTPQDAVALAEKAYTAVNTKLGVFVKPKVAKKVLTSIRASTATNNRKPGNTKEAVAAMLREKHGIDLTDE